MIRALAGKEDVVVTALACREGLSVVKVDWREESPGRNRVARLARRRRNHTQIVLAAELMAARAITQHLIVVDDLDLRPTCWRDQMTGVANIRCSNRDVSARQAVAARRSTRTQHFVVVHRERIPRRCRMAGAAVVGRSDMGAALAPRENAVVASRAQRDRRLQMVEGQNRRPTRRELVMAGVTQVTGEQSLVVLAALAHRAHIRSGVAGDAVTREGGVADIHLIPRRSHMAGVAACRGWNVRCRFAGTRETGAVAIRARQSRLGVVERRNWCPTLRRLVVAALAQVARGQANVVFSGFAARRAAVVAG